VSLALNAVLPASDLARLSEAGKEFANEGEAARNTIAKENGKEVEVLGVEAGNNHGTERNVGTSEKAWLTGESLCGANFVNEHITVKSTVTTVSPLLRTSLMILGDVAKLTPIPGLHEAARTLLSVWEAVDAVEVSV